MIKAKLYRPQNPMYGITESLIYINNSEYWVDRQKWTQQGYKLIGWEYDE